MLSTITKKIEDLQLKNRKQSSIKAYFSQSLYCFLVHSLSKNTYVSKYLLTLLFSLLFTILVKNSIKNLCWSKLCPKLNFRQNLYKADISIKRTIFFAPMVSALEGFHCTLLRTQHTIYSSLPLSRRVYYNDKQDLHYIPLILQY